MIRQFLFRLYYHDLERIMLAYFKFMTGVAYKVLPEGLHMRATVYIAITTIWVGRAFGWYAESWLKHYVGKRIGYEDTVNQMMRNRFCPFMVVEVYRKMHYPDITVMDNDRIGEYARKAVEELMPKLTT